MNRNMNVFTCRTPGQFEVPPFPPLLPRIRRHRDRGASPSTAYAGTVAGSSPSSQADATASPSTCRSCCNTRRGAGS